MRRFSGYAAATVGFALLFALGTPPAIAADGVGLAFSMAFLQQSQSSQEQEQEEQEEETPRYEEVVVVTASRTEQLLLDAPTAMSVIARRSPRRRR